MRAPAPPLDGIVLRAPAGATNPRASHRPAKPIALQGLHNPRKLACVALMAAGAWVVVGGIAWLVVWAVSSLIRLALGAL